MSDTVSTPRGMRKFLPLLLGLLALGVVVLGLWLAYRPVPEQIQGMVDTDEINVATKLPSRVEKLLVQEGDHVSAGQVLVELSSPEVTAKQQQAEGMLSSAEALQSRTGKGPRSEDVSSLRATWQSAVANAGLAQKSYVRAQALFAQGVISEQRRDEAAALRTATAEQAEAARQQYIKASIGATEEERATADAQVKMASASVAEAQALQEETRLLAPRAGEISKRFANVGELVPPGVPVFTIVDLDDLWVSFHVREDQLHGLQQGKLLRGAVPGLDKKGVAFQVFHLAAEGDFATWRATRQSSGYDIRSFEVRVRPQSPLPGLRPGMSVLFDWPQ